MAGIIVDNKTITEIFKKEHLEELYEKRRNQFDHKKIKKRCKHDSSPSIPKSKNKSEPHQQARKGKFIA